MRGSRGTSHICPNLGEHARAPLQKPRATSRRGAACCALAVGQGKPYPYNRNPAVHHLSQFRLACLLE